MIQKRRQKMRLAENRGDKSWQDETRRGKQKETAEEKRRADMSRHEETRGGTWKQEQATSGKRI